MKNMTRRDFLGTISTIVGTAFLSACSNKELEILDSVYEVSQLKQTNTYFDDLLASSEPLEVTTYHHGKESTITIAMVDAVNMLEKSISMKELLESVDESKYNPLSFSEESENEAINLDFDTVSEIEAIYDELEDEERKVLWYLKKYYNKWYENNGLIISEALLLTVLKNFGYQLDSNAIDVKIEPENVEYNSSILVITKSGNQRYIIDGDSGEVSDILKLLYDIQGALRDGTKLDDSYIRDALNLTKLGALIEVSFEQADDRKIRQIGVVNEEVLDYLNVKHR